MATIQQIKKLIRHGKQALHAQPDDQNRKLDSTRAKVTSPRTADSSITLDRDVPYEQSTYAHDGHTRDLQYGLPSAHEAPENKVKQRIEESDIARLVAEENETREVFPVHPGLERWILVQKMGDGAFSNVYKARDSKGQYGDVAIKVVRKHEMNNSQSNKHLHPDFKTGKAAERANIMKEVQIMRQLDHENIVKLIDFSESPQYFYLVLELAPGGELFHQIVRLTYFSEDLARHVVLQVANALLYLHEEKGVVHRDIKPENILFCPIPIIPSTTPRPLQPGEEAKEDEGVFIPGKGAGGIGQIKLADFGLSKIVWDDSTMTPCGTVGYTAPEIVKDERYSKSVDMWALGCVLYTLLCGFPPFYDESIETLTRKVAKGQYTFLSPWWDDISQSAKDLISHLLSVDPEQRYTIQEFLAHPWMHESGPTTRDERKMQLDSSENFVPGKVGETPGRYDFRSPGAVNLREVFDVGYAVQRQEDERRQQARIKGVAAPRHLAGLEEEDEEEDSEDDMGHRIDPQLAHGGRVTSTLEQTFRNTTLRDQPKEGGGRGRERSRVPPQPTEHGYGQHSAAVTTAARLQVRERQRQRGAFELSLDGATLLSRRGAKPAVTVGGP